MKEVILDVLKHHCWAAQVPSSENLQIGPQALDMLHVHQLVPMSIKCLSAWLEGRQPTEGPCDDGLIRGPVAPEDTGNIAIIQGLTQFYHSMQTLQVDKLSAHGTGRVLRSEVSPQPQPCSVT